MTILDYRDAIVANLSVEDLKAFVHLMCGIVDGDVTIQKQFLLKKKNFSCLSKREHYVQAIINNAEEWVTQLTQFASERVSADDSVYCA